MINIGCDFRNLGEYFKFTLTLSYKNNFDKSKFFFDKITFLFDIYEIFRH